MGIMDKLVGGSLAEPIDAIGGIIDDVWTSEGEKLDKQAVLDRIRQKPAMVQAKINQVEAQHRTIFVAGWRPFIGWVCGVALAYAFVARDLIAWALTIWAPAITPPPELAMDHLMTVLMGMLGLGAMRTTEKLRGRAK